MAKRKPTYEKSISRLEEILQQIENQDIGIDELSDKIKEANEIIEFCRTKLKTTESEINQLLNKEKVEDQE